MQFSWDDRGRDFERYHPPPQCFSPTPPVTIHLAGGSRAKELAEFTQREREIWQSRLVVDDTDFSVFRRGVKTELHDRACCQADRLLSILKHRPLKKGMAQTEQLRVDNIPALSVIGSSGMEDEQRVVGFTPGPHTRRSLRLSCNAIPITRTDPPSPLQLQGPYHLSEPNGECPPRVGATS